MFKSLIEISDAIFSLKSKNKCRVGLALGSGSARGWSHIGVMKALEEADIKPDFIAGTSMGALVSAFYSTGNIEELEKFAIDFNWKHFSSFIDVIFPKSGLIDGKKLSVFFHDHMKDVYIEDTQIPLRIVATDLYTGSEVVFSKGSLIDAVRASISVPGVFSPAHVDGSYLVDGGLVNPVPVSVVRDMGADVVIAVDLNHDLLSAPKGRDDSNKESLAFKSENRYIQELNKYLEKKDTAYSSIKQWFAGDSAPGIFEVIARSIDIAEVRITEINLKNDPADILIQPKLGHVGFFEFNKASEAINEGYVHTKEKIDYFFEAK
jgi:NTE family protein